MTTPFERRIVTPEAVALTVDVAGVGSRMIATAVDMAIQAVIGLGLGLIVAAAGTEGSAVVVIVIAFLLVWGYYPLWEGLWGGRTPGKRAQRLRVVQLDGQPATWGPILVRNVVRLVDFLPMWYVIGTITMIVTPRSQRLGDLAARTVVIRELTAPEPARLSLESDAYAAGHIDVAALDERAYNLVRSFLVRRDSLDTAARAQLAADLVTSLAPRLGLLPDPRPADETLLEAIAISYRARSEH